MTGAGGGGAPGCAGKVGKSLMRWMGNMASFGTQGAGVPFHSVNRRKSLYGW